MERRRGGAGDLDFAAGADPGEAPVMHSADGGSGVPEPIIITFAFGRGVVVVVVAIVGGPAASAALSASGIAILSVSRVKRSF